VIDVQRTQQRLAEIALPTGATVPLLPAVAATYHDTAASSKKAADDARHGRTVIQWLGVYVPIILLAVGFVLLVLVAVLFLLDRRSGDGNGGGRRAGDTGRGGPMDQPDVDEPPAPPTPPAAEA